MITQQTYSIGFALQITPLLIKLRSNGTTKMKTLFANRWQYMRPCIDNQVECRFFYVSLDIWGNYRQTSNVSRT